MNLGMGVRKGRLGGYEPEDHQQELIDRRKEGANIRGKAGSTARHRG